MSRLPLFCVGFSTLEKNSSNHSVIIEYITQKKEATVFHLFFYIFQVVFKYLLFFSFLDVRRVWHTPILPAHNRLVILHILSYYLGIRSSLSSFNTKKIDFAGFKAIVRYIFLFLFLILLFFIFFYFYRFKLPILCDLYFLINTCISVTIFAIFFVLFTCIFID